MKYYATLELGGTNLRYGLVNEQMELADFKKIPSEQLGEAEDKSGFIAGLMQPLIESVGKENVLAVSMALSSLMDKDRTFVFSSPMVKGFDQIPLKKELSSHLDLPIFLEKDVNILLLYELNRLAAAPQGISIGVFLGTGLGNALCIDGRVYPGYTGSACELGHIPVPGLEEQCGCGKAGCIELKASGNLLYKVATQEFHCNVREIFTLHAQHPRIQDILRHFAVAIATEVSILDPTMTILGGGVIEMPDFPLDTLTRMVQENLRTPEPRASFRMYPASGDSQAGIMGAAMHARNLLGI